jgi:hypothetical protein
MPIPDAAQMEHYVFGGVDVRSNPVNMPQDRSLQCNNWVPNMGGWLELRRGYSMLPSTGTAIGTPIHSMVPYEMWTGLRYLLIGAGNGVYSLQLFTGAMAQIGTLNSSNPWNAFASNGLINIGDGVNVWFFDGVTLRLSGIRSLTAAEAAAITVRLGMGGFPSPASIGLALASGGTFAADITGRTCMGAYYDLDQQELGPIVSIGPSGGFVKFGSSQELNISGLPVVSGSRLAKIPMLTDDGAVSGAGRALSSATTPITGGSVINQNPAVSSSASTNTPSLFSSPSFSAAVSGSLPSPVTIAVSGNEQFAVPPGPSSAIITISGFERQKTISFKGQPQTEYDFGNVVINATGTGINFSASLEYNQGYTAAQIASTLAFIINNKYSAQVTASASGSVLTITAVSSIATLNVSASSFTADTQYFVSGSTSFPVSIATGSGNIQVADTGTVSVTIGSSVASVAYGANSTASSVASALTAAINGLPPSGIQATQNGTNVTIQQSAIGMFVQLNFAAGPTFSVDEVIGITGSGDPNYDNKMFTVKAATSTSVTIFPASATAPITTGTISSIVSASVTGTTATLSAPSFFSPYLGIPNSGGIPASTVQSAQPGYQFYASIWNPVTQHVGNRVAIGPRLVPTSLTTVALSGFPNLIQESPEFQILIGYTIDGGEVPYLILDTGVNWISIASGLATFNLNGNVAQDLLSEMPYRNGIPPAMNKFCIVGDQALGCTGQDAYVYVSASAASPLNPEVVGQPNESWDSADVVTFPTREVPTCIQEYNQSAMVFSLNYSAPLVNTQGVWDWGQGFPCGCAGQRAFVKTIHGPFWVTGQKQLATINTNWGAGYALATGPIPVSSEYERALLANIGDAYMGQVELAYYLDVAKQKDEIIIKGLDVNGVPFEIVHDFNLKDERAPQGQAYYRQYGSTLATAYALANGVDQNGIQRVYAGGQDGNVYQEESGYNDNGSEFTAQYVGIINTGGDKPSISDIELWGDKTMESNTPLTLNRSLDGTFDWDTLAAAQDRGDGTHDFKFHNRLKKTEMQFCYIKLTLSSHSADAPTTELSSPIPHFPVEDYGKIYMARIITGASRGD